MKKFSSVLLLILVSVSCFSQLANYELHIHANPIIVADSSSFLVINSEDKRFIITRITGTDLHIHLNHAFSYPQECNVAFYYRCTPSEQKELKINGRASSSSLEFSFFILDTIQTLDIDTNSVSIRYPTELQQQYQALEDVMRRRIEEFNHLVGDKLRQEFKKSRSENDKDSIMGLDNNLFKTNVARPNLDSSLLPAIENNLEKALSLYAMKKYVRIARILQMNIPKEYFLNLLGKMSVTQKKSNPWKELKEKVSALQNTKTLVGKPAPPFFDLKDTSGNRVQLDRFRGKLVFIDFWASWCIPCKKQLPGLKEVFQKVKKNGVVFIGISLDNSAKAWKDEIIKSKLRWVNISDLKLTDGVTVTAYGVTTIPHNFLIDENGIVVQENINLEDLYNKLNVYMNYAIKEQERKLIK